MSVKLRLRRMGKKKKPFYRVVAIDSRTSRDGRYIENIGTYNPIVHPAEINIKEDRALYWLSQGAIPSDTVRSFFRQTGILLKWDLMKRGADDAVIEEEYKKWEVLQLERQKRLEALSEQKKREAAKPEEKPEEKAVKKAKEEPAKQTESAEPAEAKAEEPEPAVDEAANEASEVTPDSGDSQVDEENKEVESSAE